MCSPCIRTNLYLYIRHALVIFSSTEWRFTCLCIYISITLIAFFLLNSLRTHQQRNIFQVERKLIVVPSIAMLLGIYIIIFILILEAIKTIYICRYMKFFKLHLLHPFIKNGSPVER